MEKNSGFSAFVVVMVSLMEAREDEGRVVVRIVVGMVEGLLK